MADNDLIQRERLARDNRLWDGGSLILIMGDQAMSDIAEVTQLILHERQGRDRGWWTQMRECFHEDATVRLSWFHGSGWDFAAQSEKMSQRGAKILHRLSPPVVHIREDRAVIEVPASVEVREKIHGTEVDIVSYSRLLYRAQKRGGAWKIFSLNAIYERDTMTPAIPGASLKIDLEIFGGFRPSYRVLGYHLHTRGVAVPDNLYGDDRPEEVETLYTEAFNWLGVKR